MLDTFESCIKPRQSIIRTAKGVLGDKTRALGSIPTWSGFIRCTLALATYLLDVFSLPPQGERLL